ncbi:MAG: glycosyltransferase [Chlorobi bacterium]|nr:MAG: glycosyltransferase family 2 protein [Bacteroidota bacterium]MBL1160873.1 glycosyltransferase [Chlorobiota bacterium]MBZ0195523.1 glycosyltransferase family 2 protein [Candidatus Kapabacteria bacterium]MCC6330935.1 glycosyltransferase family 2 protein [Ignavibacteria bacterium]MBV6464108.1 Dodecaprenyl-phosphate galacturonate synthase [Chlorobiota bacterium]
MSNETKRQHTPRRRPDRYRRGYHSDKTSEDTVRRTNGTISVVIPLLNEAESLEILAAKLEKVLQSLAPDKWEVLFIDDGSTDNSFEVIQNLHSRNSKYKCIRFRTNHGKSAALAVGFMYVKGTYVITMDADLQDDPDEIPALISKLEGGYDLVSGWKRKRYDPWHKTIPSKLFNWVTSVMSGIKLHDFNCGLKGYRKEVTESVQVYGEMHRYIPALAHWEGFRVTEIPVQHHPRKYGVSKFGMSRFLKGFLDLLTVLFTTRYVKRPMHLFGAIGSLFALIGFVTDAYLVVEWFLGQTSLSNRPLALFGIAMIIVGVQLISIGLLSELIVKNSSQRERYSIREKLM